MADLNANDVTITVNGRTWIDGRHRYSDCSIAFGNSSATYPTGGVPMPAYTKFGMKRNIVTMVVEDSGVSAYKWEYDANNATLRATYTGSSAHNHNIAVAANGTVSANWGISTAPAFVTTGNATGVIAGGATGIANATLAAAGLAEPANSVAPAPQVVRVKVRGW